MSANTRPLNILLFADDRHPANSVSDHINAYVRHSHHRWVVFNPISIPNCDTLNFNYFDAIAIHYSICSLFEWMVAPDIARKIHEYQGPKFQFIQDEYRWVNRISEKMAHLGINTLFTLVRQDLVEQAYNHPGLKNVKKVSVLAGYVPEHLVGAPTIPIKDRPFDIIYRSREVQYWLGKLGQEKKWMAQGVLARAEQYGLTTDISVKEEKRIYGDKWHDFLRSGRVALGTEGGASIWDFDSTACDKAEEYLTRHPDATFEEVHKAVLEPYEGNLMYNTLSPRLFEAAALRTPLVMFPGWYNGVVEAGKHYIVLEKDFSNFADVVKKIKDTPFLEDMAARTYEDIVDSGKYGKTRYIEYVDEAVVQSIAESPAFQPILARNGHFRNARDAKHYLDRQMTAQRKLVLYYRGKYLLGQIFSKTYAIASDPNLTPGTKLRLILQGGRRFFEICKMFARYRGHRLRLALTAGLRSRFQRLLPLWYGRTYRMAHRIYVKVPVLHPYYRAARRKVLGWTRRHT
jgi:hypothetical protein